MKGIISIIFGILILASCQNTDSNKVDSVFIKGIKIPYVSNQDFEIIKQISNRDIDFPEIIPDSLLSHFNIGGNSNEIFAKNINKYSQSSNYLGEFYVVEDKKTKYICLITFNQNGKILDYLCFKHQEKEDNKWTKFFTKFYYQSSGIFTIDILSTRSKVIHPSKAEVLESKSYYVDEETGIFHSYLVELRLPKPK